MDAEVVTTNGRIHLSIANYRLTCAPLGDQLSINVYHALHLFILQAHTLGFEA